jgi:hypothetical protein
VAEEPRHLVEGKLARLRLRAWDGDRRVVEVDVGPGQGERLGDAEGGVEQGRGHRPELGAELREQRLDLGDREVPGFGFRLRRGEIAPFEVPDRLRVIVPLRTANRSAPESAATVPRIVDPPRFSRCMRSIRDRRMSVTVSRRRGCEGRAAGERGRESLLIEVDGPRREVAETVLFVGDVGVDEDAQG